MRYECMLPLVLEMLLISNYIFQDLYLKIYFGIFSKAQDVIPLSNNKSRQIILID